MIPVKKAAGRPPKCLLRKVEDRHGIADNAIDKNNVFELYHNNPEMFKAISEGCNHINGRIIWHMESTGIKILVKNENEQCDAIIDIDGSKMVRYYCGEPIIFTCDTKDFIKQIKKKKKDYEFIKFSIKSIRRIDLSVCFIKGKDIKDFHMIDSNVCPIEILSTPVEYDQYDIMYADTVNYPLSFTLNWNDFKDIINTWKGETCKDISFIKDIENPFAISFKDGSNRGEILFVNENEIELKFTSENIIVAKISILSLLCVSLSNDISKKITFFIPQNSDDKKVVLLAEVDKAYLTKKEAIENSASTIVKFFIPKSKISK